MCVWCKTEQGQPQTERGKCPYTDSLLGPIRCRPLLGGLLPPLSELLQPGSPGGLRRNRFECKCASRGKPRLTLSLLPLLVFSLLDCLICRSLAFSSFLILCLQRKKGGRLSGGIRNETDLVVAHFSSQASRFSCLSARIFSRSRTVMLMRACRSFSSPMSLSSKPSSNSSSSSSSSSSSPPALSPSLSESGIRNQANLTVISKRQGKERESEAKRT